MVRRRPRRHAIEGTITVAEFVAAPTATTPAGTEPAGTAPATT